MPHEEGGSECEDAVFWPESFCPEYKRAVPGRVHNVSRRDHRETQSFLIDNEAIAAIANLSL